MELVAMQLNQHIEKLNHYVARLATQTPALVRQGDQIFTNPFGQAMHTPVPSMVIPATAFVTVNISPRYEYRRYINDRTTRNLSALFMATTGVEVSFSGRTAENEYYRVADACLPALFALVDPADPLRPHQVALNKALFELKQHARQVRDNDIAHSRFARHKGVQLFELHDSLLQLTQNFFTQYQELKGSPKHIEQVFGDYQSNFDALVKQAIFLDQKYDYQRLLTHLLLSLAAGLGLITAGIDYGSKWVAGQYAFFPQTQSRALSNQAKVIVSSMHLNASTNPASQSG
jgi:hypothetical protein